MIEEKFNVKNRHNQICKNISKTANKRTLMEVGNTKTKVL